MFGYIKPVKAELKVKEWEAYQGIYGGLCKQRAKRYGFFARMTLNYDFVFLAMLDMALHGKRIHFCREHCIVHPFKKRSCCTCNESLELCCDVAMMLCYHKLEDDLHDEDFAKRLAVRLIFPFAKRDYKKAAALHPQLAEKLRQQMQEQQKLEEQHCAQIDLASQPTACLMEEVFSSLSEDPMEKRVLERLGYLMGRWVYLIDALDDWDEDVQKGRYNPFAQQQNGQEQVQKEQQYEQAKGTLYLTVAEMRKTYDLLGIHSLDTILENILDLGLLQTVDNIMKKRLGQT